jgi:hypothetical protein
MNNQRKIMQPAIFFLGLILFALLFISCCSTSAFAETTAGDSASQTAKTSFSDIAPGDPLQLYTRFLVDKGIIKGFPDGTFRPVGDVTRAQAARAFVLAKGLQPLNDIPPTFSDVSSEHWAFGTIEAAVRAGLLNGYPDGAFRPDQPITRAEAVTLLLKLTGGKLSGTNITINDVETGHWAYQQIATAVEAGFVELPAEKYFYPDRPLHRDELARGLVDAFILGPDMRSSQLTGWLSVRYGKVTLTLGDGVTRQISGATEVAAGAKIKTGESSQAEIIFNDGSGILLDANTEIIITKTLGTTYMKADGSPGVAVDRLEIDLKRGRIYGALASKYDQESNGKLLLASTVIPADLAGVLLALNEGEGGQDFEEQWWAEPGSERERVVVDMPWGVAGIRGTFWMNYISADGQGLSLIIGKANLTAGGNTISVTGNQYSLIPGAGEQPTLPGSLTPEQIEFWNLVSQWVKERAKEIGLSLPPGFNPAIGSGTSQPGGADIFNIVTQALEQVLKEEADTTTTSGGGGGSGSSDKTPPTVTSSEPSDGREDVPVTKTITITFSKKVEAGSNFDYITLKAGDTIVPAIYSVGGGTDLSIDPVSDLDQGVTYTVYVPAGAVKDKAGNTLENDYTFSFTTQAPPPGVNAGLSGLSLSEGSLSPQFSPGTTGYSAEVPFSVDSVSVTATTADPNAGITINGEAAASGVPYGPVSLNVGINTINVVVTAQDGVTQMTYTVEVTRGPEPSHNADLSDLSLSEGTLVPAFSPGATGYNAEAPFSVDSVSVTATTADPNAAITVNGEAAASGVPYGPVSLNVGLNTINVAVTAQDGVTQMTYTVEVTRGPEPSHNADLSGLSLSEGNLLPLFSPGTTGYSARVTYYVSSITVTAVTADPNAGITINGEAAVSGVPYGPVGLNVGINTINVVVTAQDGTTQKTYTIEVTREPSHNADLSGLSLSEGILSPQFSPEITSYSVGLAYHASSITVTAVTVDQNATITINGDAAVSSVPFGPVSLELGLNTINVVVTAQDGTTQKTYTIEVTSGQEPSHNADLSTLSLSVGSLSPEFSPDTTSYSSAVAYDVSVIDVTATAAGQEASIRINGSAITSGIPHTISLDAGANIISIEVTAQDGTTVKTYTIVVTRAEPSHNAKLSGLTTAPNSIEPVFDPDTTRYNAGSVLYPTNIFTVTATAADVAATITINGTPVSSGNPQTVGLNEGFNSISVVVTAQDGVTTNTYTISVLRLSLSHNADLSALDLSYGRLSPGFSAEVTSYSTSAPYSVSAIDVTATAAGQAASITINGAATTSGIPHTVSLIVGLNVVNIEVTAQDGYTVKTYTINITRAQPSHDASLNSLVLSQGSLTPSFNPQTTDYDVNDVIYGTPSITLTPTAAGPGASIKVNGIPVISGNPSGAIGLIQGGVTYIYIEVTAQDGSTTMTYIVAVWNIG